MPTVRRSAGTRIVDEAPKKKEEKKAASPPPRTRDEMSTGRGSALRRRGLKATGAATVAAATGAPATGGGLLGSFRRLVADVENKAKKAYEDGATIDKVVPPRQRDHLRVEQVQLEARVASARIAVGAGRERNADTVEKKADAAEQKIRQDYWKEHQYYVDPSTGTTFLASYDAKKGDLTLARSDRGGRDDEGRLADVRMELTFRADGSSLSATTTSTPLENGAVDTTTWRRGTDPTGKPTTLEREQVITSETPEAGKAKQTTTTTFDLSKPPMQTPNGPMPVAVREVMDLEQEKTPPVDGLPSGPSTLHVETELGPDGMPLRQASTRTLRSPNYDGKKVEEFEQGIDGDLSQAADDKWNPNKASMVRDGESLDNSLPIGEQSVTINEEVLFDTKGQAIAREQKTETVAIEAGHDDKDHNGVTVSRTTRDVTQGVGNAPRGGDSFDKMRDLARDGRLDGRAPIDENSPGKFTQKMVQTSYDPTGSTFREGHSARQRVVAEGNGLVAADGTTSHTNFKPLEVDALLEGADDDWQYDKLKYEVDKEGKPIADKDPEKLAHEQDLDWHEEGIAGAVINNLGTIGGALITAGMVLQAIPVVGNAVGAGLIIAGGVASGVDALIQVNGAIKHIPGKSFLNAAFSATGVIPGIGAARGAIGATRGATAFLRAAQVAAGIDVAGLGFAGVGIAKDAFDGGGFEWKSRLLMGAQLAAVGWANGRMSRVGAGGGAGEVVPPEIARLSSSEALTRIGELSDLSKISMNAPQTSINELVALSQHSSPQVRARAISAIDALAEGSQTANRAGYLNDVVPKYSEMKALGVPEGHPFKATYESLHDFMGDPQRVYQEAQTFERRVVDQAKARKVSLETAREQILAEDFQKAGFGKRFDVADKAFSDAEWTSEVLARGAVFRDTTFVGGAHGGMTHEFQAELMLQAISRDPAAFGLTQPGQFAEAWKAMGTMGEQGSRGVWGPLFDQLNRNTWACPEWVTSIKGYFPMTGQWS